MLSMHILVVIQTIRSYYIVLSIPKHVQQNVPLIDRKLLNELQWIVGGVGTERTKDDGRKDLE